MSLFSPELESAVASDGYASFAHYAIVGHDSASFSSDPLPCGRCFQLHYLPQAGSAHCYSSLGQCGYGAASGQDTSTPPAKDLIVQVLGSSSAGHPSMPPQLLHLPPYKIHHPSQQSGSLRRCLTLPSRGLGSNSMCSWGPEGLAPTTGAQGTHWPPMTTALHRSFIQPHRTGTRARLGTPTSQLTVQGSER